jgi:hypothetical protein
MWDVSYVLFYIFVAGLSIGTGIGMVMALMEMWIYFKWEVLGRKPSIYNQELVDLVIDAYTDEQIERNKKALEQGRGGLSDEEIADYKEGIKKVALGVITWYSTVFVDYRIKPDPKSK